MAGRIVNSKKVAPLLEEEPTSFWYLCGPTNAIDEEVKSDRALERFSDDPLEAGISQDEPYLFSNYSNNRTFSLTIQHPRYNQTGEYQVRSMYRCLELTYGFYRHFREPCNCIILLISDGKMFIGHYKDGKLDAQREMSGRRNNDGSEKNPRAFLKDISSFLRTWEERFDEAELVFVRCTQIHYFALFEGLAEWEKRKYRHIPFVTCPPSVEEVQRVYSRLFTYVSHGNVDQALADLQQERKSWTQVTSAQLELSKKSTKNQRKGEKQQFPWLDARTAAQIHESVARNDGDRLEELLCSTSKTSEMRDYLNQPQEKLNNGTFLHYAVRNEKFSSVEVLLEFGADPTVEDGQKKVPFDYCKSEKMEEIFHNFREENEENYDWNKAKIVERIVPVKAKQREEFDKRAARDKLRGQRREKLDKRRVKVEAY